MSEYPEHDRLHEVVGISQAIGVFLDEGLPRMGLVLAVVDKDSWSEDRLVPTHRSIQAILAEYFGIDQAKIDAEKEAMLEAMRA